MKLGLVEIPENELIEFNFVSDSCEINAESRDKVIDLVANRLTADGKLAISLWDLANKPPFGWEWKTGRGTLPKRIDSWYYTQSKKSLGQDFLSKIGNIAREEIPKDKVYYFDITHNFTWDQGEFGDHGSCFFDDKRPSGTMSWMAGHEAYRAVRFFKKMPASTNVEGFAEKFYESKDFFHIGISRAWLCDSVHQGHSWSRGPKLSDTIAVFNGYGYETKLIANVLSGYLNTQKKGAYCDGSPHINGEFVYLLSNRALNQNLDNVSLIN